MRLMKFLLAFVLIGTTTFAQGRSPLRQKEPHWRPKIIEYFKEGLPKRVLFYEQISNDQEAPVKQLMYYPSGQLKNEMDLTTVDEGSPGFTEWKTTIVPHGGSVSFFADGQVEKVAFYDRGIVHGEVRVFYPNGNLHGVATFIQGQRDGNAASYYQDGKKAEEVTYEQGKIVGDLVRYYPNEERAVLIPYAEGVPHGNALEWHENGSLKSNRYYANGVLNTNGHNPALVFYDENRNMIEVQDFQGGQPIGSHLKYHTNGKESYKVRFRDGKKHGKEQFFSIKGELTGEGEYIVGIAQGVHWRKHENGNQAFRASYDKEGELLEPIVIYSQEGHKKIEYSLLGDVRDGTYREWYDNDQLKTEYHYVKGHFDGEQTEYYPNLKKKMHSFFKDQKREGVHEEWHENGALAAQIHYTDGEKNGSALRFFENGAPHFEENYVKDQHDKEQKEWHENGKLKFQGRFILGKKQGRHQQWNEEGVLVMQATFIDDQPDGKILAFYGKNKPREILHFKGGKREGKAEEYHENGKLKMTASYKDDELDGELKGWHESGAISMAKIFLKGTPIKKHAEYYPPKDGEKEGQLARVFHYNSEGQLDGEQNTYYPNGITQTVVSYKNGELDGIKALLDIDGNLIEEAYYHAGKLNGRFFERTKEGKEVVFHYKDNRREGLHEVFYPSHQFFGKVKALELNFINDKPEGEAIEYNEAGVKISITPYKAGLKEGMATIFNPQGRMMATVHFKDDVQNGLSIQYFPTGKIYREVNYIKDLKQGEEKTYFEDGKLAGVVFYTDGEKNGLYQEWNREGVLVFEGEYKEGMRHGNFNKYYDNGQPKILQTYVNDKLDRVKKTYDTNGEVKELK